jgi:hypothetical protein
MNQTGLESELDGIVKQYLRDVDHALAKLNPNRRAELVEEIEQHLAELRSQYPVHSRSEMENLLDRVGRPADIAAAALEDDDGSSESALRRRTTRIVVVVLLVVILASLGTALALTTSSNKSPSPGHAAARVTVPNVLGMSQAAAEVTVEAAGLTAGEVQMAPSSTIGQGLVTSQAPQAGSRMPTGSEISLTVSSGSPPSTSPTSQVATELPSGIYLDGGSGTPHYYVSLKVEPDGTLSGALSYLYQDGQTSPVFSFSGPTNSGTATLTRSTGGSPISLTYSANQMQFGECTQYLKFATSLAQCTFTFSPGGNLQ